MKNSLLSVVVLISALLPLRSDEWRDAARGQRERADRLRERGLQVCRRHEFLDGGIFRRKEIFREDYSDRNFHWCTLTNTFNGEIVNAGFAGTGLRILRSFRWQDGVKRDVAFRRKGHVEREGGGFECLLQCPVLPEREYPADRDDLRYGTWPGLPWAHVFLRHERGTVFV